MEKALHGRYDIYAATDYITEFNVVAELNKALDIHKQNIVAEEYLYWYRRGVTPVLERTKEVRPEIVNRVVENHAEEIVTFKDGYFLQKPVCYVARNEASAQKVLDMNEYLYRSGKHDVDNSLADWFHTVGKAALFVEPGIDDEVPVKTYALDPRSAFVAYSLHPDKHPVMGVNMVIADRRCTYDVFTNDAVYKVLGGRVDTTTDYVESPNFYRALSVVSVEKNQLGAIPIVEYRYNAVNMCAFEAVLPLLDSLENIMSNRVDGIEQFIQSLAVAVNCDFDEDTTANDIRKAGMIVLKSIGENKADFKILSEQLNQTESQVLVDYLYQQILTICGMPNTTKGQGSTSDNGVAVLARDGWYQADTFARNTEDLFKASNRYFDRIFIEILKRKGLIDIKLSDFELQFSHGETTNVQAKAQAFNTMLASGFAPILAAQKSGISNDPVNDIAMSEKYLKMIWGDPDAPKEEPVEVVTEVNDAENDSADVR